MKLNESVFKLFEEWKDSEDYLIQSWFKAQFDEADSWFKSDELKGFVLNDKYWSSDDNYLIYTGALEFSEETIDYKLDFIIEFEKVLKGLPSEFNLVLSGYTTDLDSILLGKLTKNVESSSFTIDYLINMISEFKEKYKNE